MSDDRKKGVARLSGIIIIVLLASTGAAAFLLLFGTGGDTDRISAQDDIRPASGRDRKGDTSSMPAPKTVQDLYPGLASVCLGWARPADLADGVLLRYGDKIITEKMLQKEKEAFPPFMEQEADSYSFYLLEQKAVGLLLPDAAGKAAEEAGEGISGKSDEEIVKGYLSRIRKSVSVTEKEIMDYFKQHREELGLSPADFADVKKDIRSAVLYRKQEKAVQDHIRLLSSILPVEVSMSWTGEQAENVRNSLLEKMRLNGKPTVAMFSRASC